MKNRINVLIVFIIIGFFSLPVYAGAYENVSLGKIVFQLIFYIIVFVLVVFLSLYGTKLVAKNFKGISSSKYMSLIDVINIPGGSKIIMVKINEKIYILSVTSSNVALIDSIDEESFNIELKDFDSHLTKYLNKDHSNFNINNKLRKLINKSNIIKDKEDKNNEKRY